MEAERSANRQQMQELVASFTELREALTHVQPTAEGQTAGTCVESDANDAHQALAARVEQLESSSLAGSLCLQQLTASVDELAREVKDSEAGPTKPGFQELRMRMESLESNLCQLKELVATVDKMKENLEDLKAATADPAVDLRTSMLRLKTRVDDFESQLAPAKVRSAIVRIDRIEASSTAGQAQLKQLEGDMQAWKEACDSRARSFQEELIAVQGPVDQLNTSSSANQTQMQELAASMEGISESVRQLQAATAEPDAELPGIVEAVRMQMNELRSEVDAMKLGDVSDRMEHLEASSSANQTQMQELAASMEGISGSVRQLQAATAEPDAELPGIVEAVRMQMNELRSEVDAIKLGDVSGRMEHLEASSSARQTQMQELAASMEGISESVRQLQAATAEPDAELPGIVEAVRMQMNELRSEVDAMKLGDVSDRMEHLEASSSANQTQMQELAASMEGISGSVRQLQAATAEPDAELPGIVEAVRMQMNELRSEVDAIKLGDVSGRMEHLEASSSARQTQMQELAASMEGISESVRQLKAATAEPDAELPGIVEAVRMQMNELRSEVDAMKLGDVSGRMEHLEASSSAKQTQMQELAASMEGISESVKKLQAAAAEPDAELPGIVEAVRMQMNELRSEVDAIKLGDVSDRMEHLEASSSAKRTQMQELAASMEGISESVRQLKAATAPDAELPGIVEAVRMQMNELRSEVDAIKLGDVSGRMDHLEASSSAKQTKMQELASSMEGISNSVKRLQAAAEPDAELPGIVEAVRTQMNELRSEVDAIKLGDVSGRMEHLEASSSAKQTQMQELAASMEGSSVPVEQLQATTAGPDADFPGIVEAFRMQMNELRSEVDAIKLGDVSGRMEHLEASSSARQTQMQELAASMEGIIESVRQLKAATAEPDAELPGIVEAVRMQMNELRSEVDAMKLGDVSGRMDHLEASSSAKQTQMQGLAASMEGSSVPVEQLQATAAGPDADSPGVFEALRLQVHDLQSEVGAILARVEQVEISSSARQMHMQELAAGIDDIRHGIGVSVKQLQAAGAEPDAELPVVVEAVEAMRRQMNELRSEVDTMRLGDFSSRMEHLEASSSARQMQMQELAASMEGISNSVKQLQAAAAEPDAELPAILEAVETMRRKMNELWSEVDAIKLGDVSSRVENLEASSSARQMQMQELASSMEGISESVRQLQAAAAEPDAELPGIVEAVRTQMNELRSEVDAIKLGDVSGRMDHLEASSSAKQTQMQELAASMEGSSVPVEQLQATAAGPDADSPGVFEALRLQVHDLQSEVGAVLARVEQVEISSSARQMHMQELAAGIDDIRHGIGVSVKQLQAAGAEPDAELPVVVEAVEAMRRQMNELRSEVDTMRLGDVSSRMEHLEASSSARQMQMQELAASMEGISNSVKQLQAAAAEPDAELPAILEAVETMRRKMNELWSEVDAIKLGDVSSRVENLEASSSARQMQMQELASSMEGISESVRQLQAAAAEPDAELPGIVEAVRTQMNELRSEVDAIKLGDVSGRMDHLEASSSARQTQMQELAASMEGSSVPVEQLQATAAGPDADSPGVFEALRLQVHDLQSEVGAVLARVEQVEISSSARQMHMQELAAGIDDIRHGIGVSVKQLQAAGAEPDAELPVVVEAAEAMRRQMNELRSEVDTMRLGDFSSRMEHLEASSSARQMQTQELAASIGDIQGSVVSLGTCISESELKVGEAIHGLSAGLADLEARLQSLSASGPSFCESLPGLDSTKVRDGDFSAALAEIAARVDQVELAVAARQDRLQQLAGLVEIVGYFA